MAPAKAGAISDWIETLWRLDNKELRSTTDRTRLIFEVLAGRGERRAENLAANRNHATRRRLLGGGVRHTPRPELVAANAKSAAI